MPDLAGNPHILYRDVCVCVCVNNSSMTMGVIGLWAADSRATDCDSHSGGGNYRFWKTNVGKKVLITMTHVAQKFQKDCSKWPMINSHR